MWMDAYVHDVLIRQQIAESDRTAAVRHFVRIAKAPRPPRPWWAAVPSFVRSAAAALGRRSAAPETVR